MGHDMSILLLVMIMLIAFVHGSKLLIQIDAVTKQKCGVPQPRLINLEELQLTNPSMIYVPAITVLYQCDYSTGQCSETETCHAVEEQSVTLVFKQHNMSTGKSVFILRNETNHTKCGCGNMSHMLTTVVTLPDIKHETLAETHQKHIDMVDYFTNLPPQPRLIPLPELNLTSSEAIYVPNAGIINECIYDKQFCSMNEDNEHCKCIEVEEKKLYFVAQDTSTNSQLTVRTKQHKSCSCASKNKRTEPTATGLNKAPHEQYNACLILLAFMVVLSYHRETNS